MSKLLILIAGFAAGAAILAGTVVALDETQAPALRSSALAGAAPSGTRTLVIQHVQRGCHVWSAGGRRSASMRLDLSRGSRLVLVDQDVDPQGLVQLAGPRLAFGNHMMVGRGQTLVFTKPGLYRFRNRVVEMGPMLKVKTIGPDNVLRLTVAVR